MLYQNFLWLDAFNRGVRDVEWNKSVESNLYGANNSYTVQRLEVFDMNMFKTATSQLESVWCIVYEIF